MINKIFLNKKMMPLYLEVNKLLNEEKNKKTMDLKKNPKLLL